MRMVSMGVKEIFPLSKCDKFFDLMFPSIPMCPYSLFYSSNKSSTSTLNVDACISSLHFGILIPKKIVFNST
jgi:hypothetical protein